MIIALAGRRVDSEDAKELRFPLQSLEVVRTRVRTVLEARGATALVSSAACGADLIALSEAGRLGLRRRVILPFERARFRETSVTDRPGEWGLLYDQILDGVEAASDLIILRGEPDHEPYEAANRAILDEAATLAAAAREPLIVLLVWDGVSRGADDLTNGFGMEARRRGLPVAEVMTL